MERTSLARPPRSLPRLALARFDRKQDGEREGSGGLGAAVDVALGRARGDDEQPRREKAASAGDRSKDLVWDRERERGPVYRAHLHGRSNPRRPGP